MDFKKVTDHVVLLLIVAVASLGVATLVRLAVLRAGEDAGTANLVFVVALALCAVVYLIIRPMLEKNIMPWALKKLGFKERPATTAKETEPVQKTAGEPAQPIEPIQTAEPAKPIESPKRTTPAKPKDLAQMRAEAAAKERERLQINIKLFQEYSHIVVGIYMADQDVATLDKCIECYAMRKELPRLTPLRTTKLDSAELFHFGWNMHNFFKTGDKQLVVAKWLQEVFHETSKLSDSTIAAKLKHNERGTYRIPISEDIRMFMAEKEG